MSTPPAYHDHHPALAQDVLADDPYSTPSSPQYTLDAPPCERVLQTSSATTSSGSFTLGNASSSEFVFKGYAMEINLGPKLWGLMLPAFGHNGNVEGTVKLYKNCTHTLRLVVSVGSRFPCYGVILPDRDCVVLAHWPSYHHLQQRSRHHRGRLRYRRFADCDYTSTRRRSILPHRTTIRIFHSLPNLRQRWDSPYPSFVCGLEPRNQLRSVLHAEGRCVPKGFAAP